VVKSTDFAAREGIMSWVVIIWVSGAAMGGALVWRAFGAWAGEMERAITACSHHHREDET
jgi:hypothetical protein